MTPKNLHKLQCITNNIHSNKAMWVPFWSFDMYLSYWLPSADSQSTKIERFRTYGRPCNYLANHKFEHLAFQQTFDPNLHFLEVSVKKPSKLRFSDLEQNHRNPDQSQEPVQGDHMFSPGNNNQITDIVCALALRDFLTNILMIKNFLYVLVDYNHINIWSKKVFW